MQSLVYVFEVFSRETLIKPMVLERRSYVQGSLWVKIEVNVCLYYTTYLTNAFLFIFYYVIKHIDF